MCVCALPSVCLCLTLPSNPNECRPFLLMSLWPLVTTPRELLQRQAIQTSSTCNDAVTPPAPASDKDDRRNYPSRAKSVLAQSNTKWRGCPAVPAGTNYPTVHHDQCLTSHESHGILIKTPACPARRGLSSLLRSSYYTSNAFHFAVHIQLRRSHTTRLTPHEYGCRLFCCLFPSAAPSFVENAMWPRNHG